MAARVPTATGYFMYTKSNCKWCDIAKATLPQVVAVNVDHLLQPNNLEFLHFVARFSGTTPTTFPMVFYNNIYLGGCTESLEHLQLMEDIGGGRGDI